MLTTTALTALKNCIKSNISLARYKVGSTYHDAPINSADILTDGRLAITFLIDHTVTGNITVTEAQLLDRNRNIWAAKPENITRKAVQEGILYRYVFTITES